ncbi:MAG: hypothetical protein J6X10_01255 [Bacteroidales bacterium]|nr:hypothetical protein [Bacteroidales bacterium]
MGYSLSSISELATLREHRQDDGVKQTFDSFKLTAIILCDPRDEYFNEKLKRDFRVLSHITGRDMLFIAFFKDADSRENLNQLMRRVNHSQEDYSHCLAFMNDGDTQMDEFDLANLAMQFNINISQLPVIILTDDLSSDDYIVLKTTKNDIGYQLAQLAYYAASHRNHKINIADIDPNRFGIYIPQSRLKTSISNILASAIAKIRGRWGLHRNEEADKLNKQNLEENIRQLETIDDNDDSTLAERELAVMNYGANRFALIAQDAIGCLSSTQYIIDERKMRGACYESLVTLRTYNILTNLLNIPSKSTARYDYSVLSLCFGKIFENELATSIVQQMRQAIGIPMPQYYNKPYTYHLDSKINTDGDDVDLNQSSNGIYQAPTIGKTRMAYNKMIAEFEGEFEFYSPLHSFEPGFVEDGAIWDSLNRGRNKAAHRNPVNYHGFYNMFCAFNDFLDRYFYDIVAIRNEVKPQSRDLH